MTGKELIKKILDENGLDREYDIVTKNDKEMEKAMSVKSLSDICTVSIFDDEIELVTDFPMIARKFGLHDVYEKYVWDGHTVYFHKHKNEPSDWSISYGGGSTTIVAASVSKYRDKMVEEMTKQIYEKGLTPPEWMNWRIRRYKSGGDIYSIFGKEYGPMKQTSA